MKLSFKHHRSQADTEKKPLMRTCPECYIELKIANREGVEIDFCPQCRGIWLDHGELEKLIERASHVSYQSYQPPPGYQQGPAPSYQSHQPPAHHDPYAHQGYPPQGQHGHHQNPHSHSNQGYQPSLNDLKRLKHEYKQYKQYKKHKHHPVAGFLEDIFDVFS